MNINDASTPDNSCQHTQSEANGPCGNTGQEDLCAEPQTAESAAALSAESPAEALRKEAAALGIELPDEQVEKLAQYCHLLWDWNTKINLTRHTDYHKFVTRDLLDSLAFSEFLSPGELVLDVGTGGGVPGVVLAIVRPDLHVALSESVGKKARAVADIVNQLNLKVPVYAARAEQVIQQVSFNTLVIRAVGKMRKVLGWFRPYWQHFDRMLLVKGPGWVQERGEARHYGMMRNLALRRLKEYRIPDTGAKSVVLQICPKDRMIDKKQCRLRKFNPRLLRRFPSINSA